jgi:hypothetical protein
MATEFCNLYLYLLFHTPPWAYAPAEPPGASPSTAPAILLLAVAGTGVQPEALQPLLEAVQVSDELLMT